MTNRVLSISERGIEIETIKKNGSEKEVYEFSDVIKFMPSEEIAEEFMIIVQKHNIKETYNCTHLQDLIAEYLKVLDLYLVKKISHNAHDKEYEEVEEGEKTKKVKDQKEQNGATKQGQESKESVLPASKADNKAITGMVGRYGYCEIVNLMLSNIGFKEFYTTKLTIFRSFLRIELHQTDDSIASSQ